MKPILYAVSLASLLLVNHLHAAQAPMAAFVQDFTASCVASFNEKAAKSGAVAASDAQVNHYCTCAAEKTIASATDDGWNKMANQQLTKADEQALMDKVSAAQTTAARQCKNFLVE